MKIALLCSGLGHINRGHEVFAKDLFGLLRADLDITLFKGGGAAALGEVVVDNLPRNSALLRDVHVAASPKWVEVVREEERIRIECETFAYAALKPLMEGGYDVIHCLEREVCNVIHDQRHLFAKTPRLVFSNGGALLAHDLPRCDFVQEHTDHNFRRSDPRRAFMIPHGVDTRRFRPGVATDFRARHGIPSDRFVVISVGTICYWHKRMDHLIREVAAVPDIHLLIVGQESPDSPAIKALGRKLLGERVTFTTVPHDELPQAYAAADLFVLGSLFETFGIVYIEAMAMGLPVVCTQHVNQRSIVRDGIFIDMAKPGELARVLRDRNPALLARLAAQGPRLVRQHFDLEGLKQRYAEQYRRIADTKINLPKNTWRKAAVAHGRSLLRRVLSGS